MMRLSIATLALLAACATSATPQLGVAPVALAEHVAYLAADALDGRAPGTQGEDQAVRYIAAKFAAAGLDPAGQAGGWFQHVPLVEVTPDVRAQLRITTRQRDLLLAFGRDMLLFNTNAVPGAAVADAPMLFAGHGVVTADWNDYKNTDVRGRVVLLLQGKPDALAGADVETSAASKIAHAAARGAAAVLIVLGPDHSEAQWDKLVAEHAKPRLRLTPDRARGRAVQIDARLGYAAGQRVARAAGYDLAELERLSGTRDFQPVPLDVRVSAAFGGRLRSVASRNVAGLLRGARRPDEVLIFLAHHDHLGRCAPDEPDAICNGAVDNASGIAGLIELARMLASGARPARSILFLATAAEESGLLGAAHYARAPLVPLASTVAAFGMDTIATVPAGGDVVLLGAGLSNVDPVVARAAARQGRRLVANPDVDSFYTRSDHYVLASAGVPAFVATSIFAPGANMKTTQAYFDKRYHKPSDEFSAAIPFDGAAQDIALHALIARDLGNSAAWPAWRAGIPYARARAAQRPRP